jgi:hypothetical protein
MDKISKQTFTLTYGNCAENHKSMEIIGKELDSGLTKEDLEQAQAYFSNLGATCILYNLNDLISEVVPKAQAEQIPQAYFLVVKQGVDYLLGDSGADKLYMEQEVLKKDAKAFMYGRVVNKKARHNLCFSDFAQEPDYENKKGTVIHFDSVPNTKKIRKMLPKVISNPIVKKLQCEGNYYYDINTTYIGMHGDSERQIVIASRLGGDFPLYYQWYYQGEKVGKLFECVLSHGDMYFMSDKAVGYDWKKSSIYTLRHGAGPKSLIGLADPVKPVDLVKPDDKTKGKSNDKTNKAIKALKEIDV